MKHDNPRYGTHLHALTQAIMATKGPVVEIGAGHWSTPFLHQLCYNRPLVTIESEGHWANRFKHLETENHKFADKLDNNHYDTDWSVALVDGPTESRSHALINIKSDFHVVHDTEPASIGYYGDLEDVLDSFKYRKDYRDQEPWTTVVSDKYKLSGMR